jgi:hypothetical protein
MNIERNWEKFYQLNFVFFNCVANSNQLRQDLKVTEENLKKDLRGKNNYVLLL